MHSNKVLAVFACFIVISMCFLSGCTLNDIFGTSFSLERQEIIDSDGFAGFNINFTCSGPVTVKLISPTNKILDSEFFLRGTHEIVMHMNQYRGTVESGTFHLKAYDDGEEEISDETFSVKGDDISILSCTQKWCKWGSSAGGYLLVGLELELKNSGDVPAYPYTVEVEAGSKDFSGSAIPTVILPNEIKNIDCFVYSKDAAQEETLTIVLKDLFGDIVTTDSFAVVLEDNVAIKDYSWRHNGRNLKLSIPEVDFLFDYYDSLERVYYEDYSLYVFDPYDDAYIDMIADLLISGLAGQTDLYKINFAASFVQNLNYEPDPSIEDIDEYPRYPTETLGNDGGDCEDLAILITSLLDRMGYNVALLRIPKHMAVGVQLDQSIPGKKHYTDNYYFLESTSAGSSLGDIPSSSNSPSELTAYPISNRPLLHHKWKDGTVETFTGTEFGDIVKAVLYIENLGIATAEDIEIEGVFCTEGDLLEFNSKKYSISQLEPGEEIKTSFTIEIPSHPDTCFKSRIYLDGIEVDDEQTDYSFPYE